MSNTELPGELNANLTKLTDLAKQREDLKTTAINALKGTLQQLLKDIPELDGVRWAQYGPGFNDGDPCLFRVCELEVKFAGLSDEDNDKLEDNYESNGESEGYAPLDDQIDILQYAELKKNYGDNLFKYLEKVQEMIKGLEDCCQSAFGDNARVVVTRSGIEVEDYDCGY